MILTTIVTLVGKISVLLGMIIPVIISIQLCATGGVGGTHLFSFSYISA